MAAERTAIECSVLTPVLDEERHVAATIAAMRTQRLEGELQFIFADGGSTDATRQIIAAAALSDPRIQLVENPGRTVTSGLNVALGLAQGRFVARMDAHARYRSDYIARGIARLRVGDTRWVSGPQVPEGSGPVSRAVAHALGSELGRSGSRRWAQSAASTDREYDLDSGVFCGVWERETLRAYGGWDERWRVNEDSEMAARFLERGERLVCVPTMAARYSPRDTLGGLWRQYDLYGRYRMKTAVHHPDTLRRPHLAAPVLVAGITAAVVAPQPLRKVARAASGTYAAALGSIGVRALRGGAQPAEAALVPVALATMQLAWGVGTWRGIVRDGVPAAAIRRAVTPRQPHATAREPAAA